MTLEQAIDEVNADIAQFKHALTTAMGALQRDAYLMYTANETINENDILTFKQHIEMEAIQRYTQKVLDYQAQLRYLLRQRDILIKIRDNQ